MYLVVLWGKAATKAKRFGEDINPEEFGRVEVKLHKHIVWVIFTSCTDI